MKNYLNILARRAKVIGRYVAIGYVVVLFLYVTSVTSLAIYKFVTEMIF